MLSKVLSAPGVTATVPTTGAVDFTAGGTLTVTAPELPDRHLHHHAGLPRHAREHRDRHRGPADGHDEHGLRDVGRPAGRRPPGHRRGHRPSTPRSPSPTRSTDFTTALGPDVAAGDVLNLSLTNLRTGASCAAIKVQTNQLVCQEQAAPTGDDELTIAYAQGQMSGGKVANPASKPDDDSTTTTSRTTPGRSATPTSSGATPSRPGRSRSARSPTWPTASRTVTRPRGTRRSRPWASHRRSSPPS